MRRELALAVMCLLSPSLAWAQFGIFGEQTAGEEAGTKTSGTPDPGKSQMSVQAPSPGPPVGRFQLVPSPDKSQGFFLIDTATGCMWHRVENQETKRSTFVEVDVENLHWSYGSGAQQLLAERIDGSNLTEAQKGALKEELRKTGCGLSSNLVLTPGRPKPQAGGQ